jgi:hypothetical protein
MAMHLIYVGVKVIAERTVTEAVVPSSQEANIYRS